MATLCDYEFTEIGQRGKKKDKPMQRDAKTGSSFKCGHNAMESQSEKTAIECENVLLTNMNVLIL